MTAYIKAQDLFEIKACPGDVVKTPYGRGMVLAYRKSDDIYHVRLPWADAYLNSNSVTLTTSNDSRRCWQQ